MTRPLPLRVDADVELVLLDQGQTDAVHGLVLSSLDHLRPWEEIARPGLTRDEVVEYVRAGEDAWAQGRAIPAAIVYRGEVAGVVGARIAREAGRAEVGYWLGSAYLGRGIMTRAVRAVVRTLFDDEGLHRVELRTAADNQPSRAVADRLGFILEGTLRETYLIDGVRHDLCVYGRLRIDVNERLSATTSSTRPHRMMLANQVCALGIDRQVSREYSLANALSHSQESINFRSAQQSRTEAT